MKEQLKNTKTTISLPGYLKTAVFIVIVYFGWQLLILGRSILIPLMTAWLIAIALYPMQVMFEKKLHIAKGISAFLCVLIIALFSFLFLFLLAGEVSSFSKDLSSLNQKFPGASREFQSLFYTNNTQFNVYFSKAINSFVDFSSSLLVNILMSFTHALIWIIWVLVFLLFFLSYRKLLYNGLVHVSNLDNRQQVTNSIESIRRVTKHYVSGILIEMSIVATLIGVLLSAFGIQHGLMIALLSAVLNIIPYIGIYLATLLTVLITYANSNGTAAIVSGIILLSVHLLDANILIPKVIGSRVKLNPFATLIAILTGGILWGIPGMFLFVPLVAIARIALEQIPSCRAIVLLLGNDESQRH